MTYNGSSKTVCKHDEDVKKQDDDEKEHVCSARHSPGCKDILLLTSLNPQVDVQLAVQRCQREEGEALAQLGLN